MVGVYAVTTQSVDGSLTDLVLGELGHEISIVAIVGAAYGHVGLAATPDDIKIVDLHETIVSCGGKAKHDFAQCNYFTHGFEFNILIDLWLKL